MSRKELLLMASRALSLLLLAWALIEMTYLPERAFSLSHHASERSVLVSEDYWTSYYLVITILLLVRIIALLIAARVFWKSGPRVQSFFVAHSELNETSEQITSNPSLGK